MLIWRGSERIAGSYVSLKRQEPNPQGGSALSIAITQSSLRKHQQFYRFAVGANPATPKKKCFGSPGGAVCHLVAALGYFCPLGVLIQLFLRREITIKAGAFFLGAYLCGISRNQRFFLRAPKENSRGNSVSRPQSCMLAAYSYRHHTSKPLLLYPALNDAQPGPFSNGRRGRDVRQTRTKINAHHVS
jgi:hypothetical protein